MESLSTSTQNSRNSSRVISTQNWLAVNLCSHVLRVIRRGGNQTRRYQRRVHSSLCCEPVNFRRTERATPPFPKLVSQFCHELVPILT